MISKRELLSMCINLFDEVDDLNVKTDKLEKEIKKIKSCGCGKNIDGVKKGPGRPPKCCKDKKSIKKK